MNMYRKSKKPSDLDLRRGPGCSGGGWRRRETSPCLLPLLEVQSWHPRRVKHVPTFLTTQSGMVLDGVPITPDFVAPGRVQRTLKTVPVGPARLTLRPADYTQPVEEHGAANLVVPPSYIEVTWCAIPPRLFDVGVGVGLHYLSLPDRLLWSHILGHDCKMM